MEKLELKHLAPYLPYRVMFQSSMDKLFDEFGKQPIWHLEGISKLFGNYCLATNNDAYGIARCRLILRPLSDLTKEIEHNEEKFVPIEVIDKHNNLELLDCLNDETFDFPKDIDLFPFWLVNSLIEWHFDVFGLIDKGLAIDINTI